ncbi:MAG: sodium:solute symporter [Chitinophagales bacterium]|nr:sodium:solute symporter [Bacteroidota bacterium]MBX7140242.1 sodium:solute symporter [Chitinophagales bacterium]
MSPALILSIVFLYFIVLLFISFYTARGANAQSFFIGNKKSKWYIVAYGMIGTSLSGVTFMSVPGEVGTKQFAYMQIVLGYLFGYFIIALVLLPLYYRLNLTSIYTYLRDRFGNTTYKTGSLFFILSRTLGASIRVFLVVNMLQVFVLDPMGIPFGVTGAVIIALILVYTFKGGVKTIVWTDMIQTTCMLAALILCTILVMNHLGYSPAQMVSAINEKELTKTFFWDWKDKKFFGKQFLSGIFITVAMTGLDQEMMQKNLSCKNLKEAQKNMFTFSFILVLVNLMFLTLGAVLFVFAQQQSITIPAHTDQLFPLIALDHLGEIAGLIFLIGLISALYPSADGALTALTSAFCIDIINLPERNMDERKRTRIRYLVHFSFAVVFLLCIIYFRANVDSSVISTLLAIAGYTYGPLLGLYSFGMFMKKKIHDKLAPVVCVVSPLICYYVNLHSQQWFNGYQLGFEVLVLNGLLTFLGLLLISKRTIIEHG